MSADACTATLEAATKPTNPTHARRCIPNYGARLVDRPRSRDVALLSGNTLPLFFLLFMAFATGALAAYAGRDEIRHSSSEAMWRAESFLAYAVVLRGLVLLPTGLYFYVFHGDWFLLYWVNTGNERLGSWGLSLVWSSCTARRRVRGASAVGAALCRGSRDSAAARRLAIVLMAVLRGRAVWPLAWERLSQSSARFGSTTRDYGLVSYFESPAFYSGSRNDARRGRWRVRLDRRAYRSADARRGLM